MNYTEEQVREQLKRGPDEYDIFRVKVKGDGATKWLNVPQSAVVALADAVSDDPPRAGGGFSLTIKLGNAAMSTPADVGDALRGLSGAFIGEDWPDGGKIWDRNGNTVGTWSVEDPPEQVCDACGLSASEPHPAGEWCNACGGGCDA